MTESKHTPGPWAVHYEDVGDEHVAMAPTGILAKKELVCRIGASLWEWDYGPEYTAENKEKMDANARLIALAPELLEACEESLITLATHSNDAGIPEKGLIRKLEKIIAKAKGGTQ